MDLFHLHEAFKYYSVFMHIHFGRHNSSKRLRRKAEWLLCSGCLIRRRSLVNSILLHHCVGQILSEHQKALNEQ